ncbi:MULTISPECIES: cytochrome c biogenesis protein CcdA [unclassified Paenibacillus]|uniref:cytochrome c biogenesis CcdA family protein n=1 Tax=unclassified Paenibacillus TaxID=185978 RepID=UPI000953AB80|nr:MULTISPECIES: cytochrome c biogenesis protein CcdA [unclassified Paenibacillus]ASS65017.1 cytochrome c biogenesis protein CcdA [Paenibacillus sp. RUD330]SIQ51327.1 cytochrome c-type biogenesis protein [Paenibacillus sp. RU4X]SIQ73601.1 cytochrome c-type biogenesis protein [Paenibacillus sp. RU4T]
MSSVNIGLAFAAGIASFVSPCCLPLYPSYLSYITGISVTELKSDNPGREVRRRTMSHTLFFILGFSLVYYTLGYGTNRFAELFADYQDLIRQLSAILIMLMGLFLIGLFQPRALMRDFKMPVKLKSGYLGSFIFGIGFSAGWSPCVGPILAAILALAASDPGTWFGLTTAYALGFAIPFFVLAFFIGSTRWIVRYSSVLMKIGGALMLVMGVLLFTNKMSVITIYLNGITPEWLRF